MLYDPKWEKPEADPMTIEGFIAWLETKDPNEHYEYCDPVNCALGQYRRAVGATVIALRPSEIPPAFMAVVRPSGACKRTFGAALKRARKIANVYTASRSARCLILR